MVFFGSALSLICSPVVVQVYRVVIKAAQRSSGARRLEKSGDHLVFRPCVLATRDSGFIQNGGSHVLCHQERRRVARRVGKRQGALKDQVELLCDPRGLSESGLLAKLEEPRLPE